VDPITFAKLWMVVKPIRRIKEARQRRRAERMAEQKTVKVTLPDGSTYDRVEPTIDATTSTKLAATGFALGLPLIQGIQEIVFPWGWLESFTNSDLFVQLATLGLAYITAKLTKSPFRPK
jgi:hypothetical protein